jgi:hypothetical protein
MNTLHRRTFMTAAATTVVTPSIARAKGGPARLVRRKWRRTRDRRADHSLGPVCRAGI